MFTKRVGVHEKKIIPGPGSSFCKLHFPSISESYFAISELNSHQPERAPRWHTSFLDRLSRRMGAVGGEKILRTNVRQLLRVQPDRTTDEKICAGR